MDQVEFYIIAAAALLSLSVIASKATGRLGVPSLLVFLGLGMLAGSEGIGGFYFDNAFIAQTLGVLALIFILFSGGLDTAFSVIRPVLGYGAVLATLGVFITCVATGWFASTFLGFSWIEGMLLGAIISSTDAAAVFAILRARSVSLRGQIKPLLELESGSNDPMAVLLVISFLQLLTLPDASILSLVALFFRQMIVGAALGYVSGKGMAKLLNYLKLEFEGLYPVMTVALILLIYGVTQTVGGNGFLAVYLAGLILGNENFIHKKSLTLFHDGLSWIFQIVMFLTLGLLVYPSRLVPIIGSGVLLSVFLIFVARPLAVFTSLFKTQFGFREKSLISWVGLRGAVPIVLATYPLLAGIPKADHIFNLVFFVVITSVLIQGSSIPFVAKLLKVDAPMKQKFRYPIEYVPTGDMKNNLTEIEIPSHSNAIGKSLLELNLPKETLVVLIHRQGNAIVPKGSTQLEEDDGLLVLANKETFKQLQDILFRSKEAE